LGLGYTIPGVLFNPIFTLLLTRNLLFGSGLPFLNPVFPGRIRQHLARSDPVNPP
jgi:hypothetical protein